MNRKAFTLLELLVVLTIIVILAGMMVLILRKPSPEPEAASRLQGWLVEARTKALQLRRPVGLRVVNGTPSFIEQPDDWSMGTVNMSATPPPPPVPPGQLPPTQAIALQTTGTVTIQGDFTGQDIIVGDWIEKGDGEASSDILPITSVSPTTLTAQMQPDSWPPFWTSMNETQWRIVRQPRAQLGGTPLSWPTNVSLTPDGDTVFGPSGALVGTSVPQRFMVGGKFVVQVNAHTGMVAVHPVAPGPDPYVFCRDGRSSGY